MRRLLASLVLVCLGLILPVAASPLCVCLLKPAVVEGCCPDCHEGSGLPPDCCVELAGLPDFPVPETAGVTLITPPDEWPYELPPLRTAEDPQGVGRGAEWLLRSPPPLGNRAFLEVWRL